MAEKTNCSTVFLVPVDHTECDNLHIQVTSDTKHLLYFPCHPVQLYPNSNQVIVLKWSYKYFLLYIYTSHKMSFDVWFCIVYILSLNLRLWAPETDRNIYSLHCQWVFFVLFDPPLIWESVLLQANIYLVERSYKNTQPFI